jgi:hypothetical protein
VLLDGHAIVDVSTCLSLQSFDKVCSAALLARRTAHCAKPT